MRSMCQPTLDPPCYNKATKTDCPKRCTGCHINCPQWAIYVDRRDEEYKKRKPTAIGEQMITDVSFARSEGIRKYLRRERQFRNKKVW